MSPTKGDEGGEPDGLPPRIQAMFDGCGPGKRVELGRFDEAELHAAGMLGGPVLRVLPGEWSAAEVVDVARRAASTIDGGGPLADVLLLDTSFRLQLAFWVNAPLEPNPTSVEHWRRICVLGTDGEPIALVAVAVIRGQPEPADVDVTLQLVDCGDLADELTLLAYRPPDSDAEEAATSGTTSIYYGPDRKAAFLPCSLERPWDGKGVLSSWFYDLTAKRTERDWVGRKPMTIKYRKAVFYAKHLRARMKRLSPIAGQ
ncbi:hypothetical protein [uncultured Jatrophihabitans sp.]|uniref:hypothetical protein n=1 Tax=uncultured Jatrophihabitans sp. TaxID=1610747 RepID=UPI0035CBDE32